MALKFLNNGYFAGKVGIGTESPTAKLHVSTGSSGATVYSGYNDMVIEGGNGASLSFLTPDANPVDINFGTPSSQFAAGIRAGYNSGTEFIAFKVVDSEKMRIIDTGNVGIGTNSPDRKLEVDFTSSVYGAKFTRSDAAGSSLIEFANSAGVKSIIGYDAGVDGYKIGTASATNLVVKQNGNVGIGTTTPDYQLEVENTSAQATVAITGGNTDARLHLKNNEGTWLIQNDYSNTGALSFYNSTHRVVVTEGGNVGIGTTSPGQNLEISGQGNVAIRLTSTDSTTSTLQFADSDDVNVGMIQYDHGSNYMSFRTNDNERARITAAGNIGVNTTSPSYKLSVNGTIQSDLIRGYTYPGNSFLDFDYDQTAASNTTSLVSISRVSYISDSNGNDPATSIGHSFMTGTTDIDTATPLLTILNNGNVGIGTDSPDTIMEILGANPILTIRDSDTSSSTATSTIRFAESNANDTLGNYWDVGYSPVNLLNFDFNGSTKMTINSSGNVGIGMASPSQKLEVNGAVLAGDYRGSAQIYLTSPDSWIFRSTGGSERMRVTSAGNVGIGLTNPVDRLDLYDADDNVGIYFHTATSGTGGANGLRVGQNNANAFVWNYEATPLSLATGGTARLTINATGGIRFNTGYGAGTLVTDASGNITVSSGGGAGGPYLPLAGNTTATAMTGDIYFANQQQARFLTSSNAVGLRLQSSGTSSFIDNEVGDMYIRQEANGNDMIFQADNGSGGNAIYFKLDGSEQRIKFAEETSFQANTRHNDNVIAQFGNSDDLQIYHNNTDSYSAVVDVGTGYLLLGTNGPFVLIGNSTATETYIKANNNGSVDLYYDNSKKLETTSTGVSVTGAATATTFLGDLNGTINTATTGVTQANAINNTTIATTAYVNNKIALIPAGLVFQGTWNASTNTPTLTSGSGTTGNFYIVSVAGSTNLDGITDWKVGDWAVFIEQGASDQWEKIDNSSVLDGFGTGQKVTKWDGSGTSNTLTDGPITFSGNNSTFAGDVMVSKAGAAITINSTSGAEGALHIGRSVDTKAKITSGDTAASDLCLYTNGTRALTILSNQNATFAGNITFGDSHFIGDDADDNLLIQSSANENIIINSVDDLFLRTGGTTKLIVKNGGNVGIGTTSPGEKLEVNGRIKVQTSSGSLTLKELGSSSATIAGSATVGIEAAGNFRVKTNVSNEAFTVLSTGNVGIGNTSPTAKLHVAGTGLFTGLVSGITPVNAANFVTKAYVDGSGGGTGPFLPLAGGTMTGDLRFQDNIKILMGAGDMFQIKHTGTLSQIATYEGDLFIDNNATDKDIIFRSDDGSGGLATYFRLDGGSVTNQFLKTVKLYDNVALWLGDDNDLQIYHDGSNSYIEDAGTGGLVVKTGDFYLRNPSNAEMIRASSGASVELYEAGSKKFETTSTGVTVTGDINIDSALLSNQENTDVDTGTETVVNVAIATYTAAFFDFVIKKTTNVRSGTVYACHDGTNVEFTETSTQDLGDTSDVTLSVDISGGNMRLRATTTSDNWSVKSLIRAI